MDKEEKLNKVFIVGICGPSKSGKSTLAKTLAKKYRTDWIEGDHYLKPRDEIPFKGKFRNWELPSDYRLEKLAEDLKKIKEGKKINSPLYGFRKGEIESYRRVIPNKILFVESYYLFTNKNVRDLIDLKIFLDIPKREFFKRANFTEQKEEWTQKEYVLKVIIPEYKKYGESQKRYADFVFKGNLPLDELKKKVENTILEILK